MTNSSQPVLTNPSYNLLEETPVFIERQTEREEEDALGVEPFVSSSRLSVPFSKIFNQSIWYKRRLNSVSHCHTASVAAPHALCCLSGLHTHLNLQVSEWPPDPPVSGFKTEGWKRLSTP